VNNTTTGNALNAPRIQSIDILRGLVIVLMILDHVRDYFHADAFLFSPTDPALTTIPLFATRWITHLCAPIFIWLTGISAFMYYQKKGSAQTFSFLLIRGILLIILEFTVIRFGWQFKFDLSSIPFLVISAIGFSMMILGVVQFVDRKYILITGIILIAGHNLLDSFNYGNEGCTALVWHILHQYGNVTLGPDLNIFVLYPVLPMIGLICLGFSMGSLFTDDTKEERSHLLKRLSFILLLTFMSLRLLNEYGDPSQWVRNQYVYRVVFSFLNVTKYPMSLDYILITMSIAFYLIPFIEKNIGHFTSVLNLFGKTSMFIYIVHIYVIHLLALTLAMIKMRSVTAVWHSCDWMILGKEYGYSLIIVYVIWIFVLAGLYPLSKKYSEIKAKYPDSFLKYI
jgi:uncharacterized membrane protein